MVARCVAQRGRDRVEPSPDPTAFTGTDPEAGAAQSHPAPEHATALQRSASNSGAARLLARLDDDVFDPSRVSTAHAYGPYGIVATITQIDDREWESPSLRGELGELKNGQLSELAALMDDPAEHSSPLRRRDGHARVHMYLVDAATDMCWIHLGPYSEWSADDNALVEDILSDDITRWLVHDDFTDDIYDDNIPEWSGHVSWPAGRHSERATEG